MIIPLKSKSNKTVSLTGAGLELAVNDSLLGIGFEVDLLDDEGLVDDVFSFNIFDDKLAFNLVSFSLVEVEILDLSFDESSNAVN